MIALYNLDQQTFPSSKKGITSPILGTRFISFILNQVLNISPFIDGV